jgi:hypothetical protein
MDQDIVQVSCTENIEIWAKGLVDISLKYCRCICELKGPDQKLKEAIASSYGSLLDSFIWYLDKAIGIANVDS